MSREEFYEKHTKTENGMYPGQQDVACSVTTPPIQLWQWIEQQIKQARVDENERWIKFLNTLPTNEVLRSVLKSDFRKRIKELTGELK